MSAWEWKEYVPERPIEERLPYNSIDLLLTDEKPKTTAKDPVGTIKPHGKLQALILMIISNFILLVFRRIITRTILLCSQIVLHTGRGSLCVLANLMHSAPNGLQYLIAQIFLFAAMRMCPKKPLSDIDPNPNQSIQLLFIGPPLQLAAAQVKRAITRTFGPKPPPLPVGSTLEASS